LSLKPQNPEQKQQSPEFNSFTFKLIKIYKV